MSKCNRKTKPTMVWTQWKFLSLLGESDPWGVVEADWQLSVMRDPGPRLSLSFCFPLLACGFHPQGHLLVPDGCWKPQLSHPHCRWEERKERRAVRAHWPQIDNMAIFSCKVGRETCSFGLGVLPRVLLPRKKGVPLAVSLWYRRYIKNDMEWLKIKGWTKLFRQTSTKRKQGWQ